MKHLQFDVMPLRRAVHVAVNGFPGGHLAVAGAVGMRPQDLRNRLSESCRGTHHLNLEQFESIVDLTRDERILQAIGAVGGGVFIPLHVFEDLPDDGAILDDMLRVMESVGAYGRVLRESLHDGDIDSDEWRKLSSQAQDIFRAVHLVQARAEFFRGESD